MMKINVRDAPIELTLIALEQTGMYFQIHRVANLNVNQIVTTIFQTLKQHPLFTIYYYPKLQSIIIEEFQRLYDQRQRILQDRRRLFQEQMRSIHEQRRVNNERIRIIQEQRRAHDERMQSINDLLNTLNTAPEENNQNIEEEVEANENNQTVEEVEANENIQICEPKEADKANQTFEADKANQTFEANENYQTFEEEVEEKFTLEKSDQIEARISFQLDEQIEEANISLENIMESVVESDLNSSQSDSRSRASSFEIDVDPKMIEEIEIDQLIDSYTAGTLTIEELNQQNLQLVDEQMDHEEIQKQQQQKEEEEEHFFFLEKRNPDIKISIVEDLGESTGCNFFNLFN